MMRNLHPENNDPDKLGEFLDSSNRAWRQACVTFFGCIDRVSINLNEFMIDHFIHVRKAFKKI